MTSIRIGVVLLLCPDVVGIAEARAVAPNAEAIIAASKRATGGAAWDKPQGCVERGTHADGAVTYLTRFSLRDYGMRTDSSRGGNTRSMGYDGKAKWTSDLGKVDIRSDPASLQEAITTDYLSINGFFFPDRFPAAFKYLRSATEGDRRFDIVKITPRGGRPLEVWFDNRAHLVRRVVDTQGTPAIRVEASDYRRGADGLIVAYRLDMFGPDGTIVDRAALASFRCGPMDRTIFAPPVAG